jgi:hypothetical protein
MTCFFDFSLKKWICFTKSDWRNIILVQQQDLLVSALLGLSKGLMDSVSFLNWAFERASQTH